MVHPWHRRLDGTTCMPNVQPRVGYPDWLPIARVSAVVRGNGCKGPQVDSLHGLRWRLWRRYLPKLAVGLDLL
jgi:hypothetical protein